MVTLEFVKELALKAGEIVEQFYSRKINVTQKASYADLVTEADKSVEEFLKSQILKSYPDHKFIAEESYMGSAVLTADPTWIIDPIDGTSNFVSRFPFVCVSIAYYINKEAVIAAVYNPILKCFYHAEKDKGAYRNGMRIHVSSETELSKSLVLTDWGGDRKPENLDKKAQNVRRIIEKARGVRTMGSAVLHICQVAAGSGDVFFEFGVHCWDYAAAILIVREAGGYCCSCDGSPVDLMARNVLCAGSPELARALIPLIDQISYPRD